ncbi:HET-domain-containing protein [Rhizodiscina lignyota]|uniref:HET-domain-containing protein n=1 Tax=Rhizodiscina lignyota TaxID=1504668 RepID=A0A9P4M981_9PEZI|nr:HET-domain-containing protein [Rhizodiscina lignyota]
MSWGRGGAGNIWQAQVENKRVAEDVEAQHSQSTASPSAPSISTNMSSEPQQYAHSGRGGAGNWYSPVELSQHGTFSSTSTSPTSPSSVTPTSATATGAMHQELPSAKSGRGGMGNFVWGPSEKEKEEWERRRQEEERVRAQATMNVDQVLAKPSSVFLPAVDDFIVGNIDRGTFYDEYYDLGTVCNVRQRASSCSLCRIALETVDLSEPTGRDDIENSNCQLHWQSEGFAAGEEEPKVRFLKVIVQSSSVSVPEFHRICLLGDDAPQGAQKLFLGRRVPDKISIHRIKSWIRSCQSFHDDNCNDIVNRPESEMPVRFRVLDVWNLCVVPEPPPDCRYLALSYVWGRPSSVLKLSTANFAELTEPRALKREWHQIPRTIQDAIVLTSSLGERYLWIDSLCIVQDDDEDKNALIPFMDMIYDRAFLTVVAATGQSSEAGLPGLHKGTRRKKPTIEQLKPGLRVMCPKHLADALDQSYYDRRGWTYQEKVFSRRRLFFIDGQVVFQCRSAVFREDVALEDWRITSCQDEMGMRFFKGLVAGDEPQSVYVATLWEYSSREFSFNSDAINAFTGILEVLVRRLVGNPDPQSSSHGSVCGLPTAIFDWALLWEPVTPLERREGASWPSWSWCGWNGRVSLFLSSMDDAALQNWLSSQTWVRWLVYEQSKDLAATHLRRVDYAHRQNALFPPDLYPPVTLPPSSGAAHQGLLKTQPLQDRSCSFLYFATLSMTFSVQSTEVFRGPWRGYQICRGDETPCGKIWLDAEWKCASGREHEFLALSGAKSSSIAYIQLPAREAEKDVNEWDAYHVMMIHYPKVGAPAQRMGLGIILQESMSEKFGAVWKDVWLQ